MPSFRVDYMKDSKGLAHYIEKKMAPGTLQGVRVRHDGNSLVIIIGGFMRRNGKRYSHVIQQVSDSLADYILKSYEKEILSRIIHRICNGLPKRDLDEINRIACKRLYPENMTENMIKERRRLISDKISEYLRTSRNLTLEGFITFRLGEYVKKLEVEVDRAIRQYFVEKQYEEYINLLTAFIRMQCPRVPELHVFVQPDGSYRVQGADPFDIPDDITRGYGIDKGHPVIRDDDFMIGFLLTCAPIRIFIHHADKFKNKELLNTIKTVFSECVLVND
ncbi:putative sporulation protein YtxC [Thermoclostridium caenicola]|uniref:Putative sporulation protein YtxC n=1 Tax=Thermoclostridium caenicola TaxID=659425 RepID=A0A1M6BMD6_9FIRM|nr:putative sporulation protein YtxC [Thermoclostridium caenicola]SHI49708.1 putative sporulation protein YtxC [Thermoclostridium caenicola]HOL84906.1 putative sporulation protein YtxC [Thermoclostridium caenicola]HPO77466.1 putative sporulation protein YtxC [Thermoclostridium caenicola]HPU22389.1 putative sporulation protein YtxC [Thermoclostridium caenicola]